MIIGINEMIYLASNAFRVYVLFMLIHSFYAKKELHTGVEMGSYCVFYLVNSVVFLLFNSTFVNLFVNVFGLLSITYLYIGKIYQKILLTVFVFVLNFAVESLVYILIVSSVSDDSFALISVLSNLVFFFVALIIQKLLAVKKGFHMPLLHWLAFFLIPVASIILTHNIIISDILIQRKISCVFAVLCINLLIFYLYDRLIDSYGKEIERAMLNVQNRAFQNQFALIKETNKRENILRHDYENHMRWIQSMSTNNESVVQYIQDQLQFTKMDGEFVRTGNLEVDSVLNYKLAMAVHMGAKVVHDIKLPTSLAISSFDLNTVLSNALDNAIEAIAESEDKWLRIRILYNQGVLYFELKNSHKNTIKKIAGLPKTTKLQPINHGIGLKSIQTVLEKNDGQMNINYDKDHFSLSVIMYEKSACF